MAKRPSQRKGAPSPTKARQILHDKEVRGHELTERQRKFFGALASKGRRMK
jgi:hypothetical protein